MISTLAFGDVVLLSFPYTDGQTYKKRPALVIKDLNDGDIIVCRITSQWYQSEFDVPIQNWAEAGLKLKSIVRVHKLATLQLNMVEKVLGRVDNSALEKVERVWTSLPTLLLPPINTGE